MRNVLTCVDANVHTLSMLSEKTRTCILYLHIVHFVIHVHLDCAKLRLHVDNPLRTLFYALSSCQRTENALGSWTGTLCMSTDAQCCNYLAT